MRRYGGSSRYPRTVTFSLHRELPDGLVLGTLSICNDYLTCGLPDFDSFGLGQMLFELLGLRWAGLSWAGLRHRALQYVPRAVREGLLAVEIGAARGRSATLKSILFASSPPSYRVLVSVFRRPSTEIFAQVEQRLTSRKQHRNMSLLTPELPKIRGRSSGRAWKGMDVESHP